MRKSTAMIELSPQNQGGDPMRYVPGTFFCTDFGESGADRCGFCLYGDVKHPSAQWAMEAAMARHPDQATLSDHQKVSFWFDFSSFRPLGEVRKIFKAVFDFLVENGWKDAESIEGFPDTGSSIGYLVDTGSPEFWGKPEARFPVEPNIQGYNAAKEFVVVMERPDAEPRFSEEEIAEIWALMIECQKTVYGRELPKIV